MRWITVGKTYNVPVMLSVGHLLRRTRRWCEAAA
jgi:hypothetical protein